MNLGVVLMAAGSGSRMGFKPKCLLHLDGVPLITRMLESLKRLGVQELVVVLGHYQDTIAPLVHGEHVHPVIHPEPDQGQISSQRLGLASLTQGHDAIIMALADQPLLETEDLQLLLERFHARPAGKEMLYPQVGQTPGNPVIITNAVKQDILLRANEYGCRQWRQDHPSRVERFLSDNTHFSCDVDTPEDILALQASTGRTLTWGPSL